MGQFAKGLANNRTRRRRDVLGGNVVEAQLESLEPFFSFVGARASLSSCVAAASASVQSCAGESQLRYTVVESRGQREGLWKVERSGRRGVHLS